MFSLTCKIWVPKQNIMNLLIFSLIYYIVCNQNILLANAYSEVRLNQGFGGQTAFLPLIKWEQLLFSQHNQ